MKHRFILSSLLVLFLAIGSDAIVSTHSEAPRVIVPAGMSIMSVNPTVIEEMEREGLAIPDLSSRLQRGIDAASPEVRVEFPNPPSGAFKTLVVAVDFSDNPSSVSLGYFDNLIFAPPGITSVADYFNIVSYGNLTLVTLNIPSSLGWQRAPFPYIGSGGYVNADGIAGTADDYGWGSYPQNLQGLTANIIVLIDQVVDFSEYDNDLDGFVDSVIFIHAGRGAELTLSPNDIWSASWNMSSAGGPGPILTQDGVSVDNFAYNPEYMVVPYDQTMGVYCHEIGHTIFGLPDLYDLDNSSYGVGNWSLMSYGSWNGPLIYIPWFGYSISGGGSPAWPDAWSRIRLEFQGNITAFLFPPIETLPAAGIGVVKLDSPQLGPQEFFW
jgi:M6 family metalloprotease-like protein